MAHVEDKDLGFKAMVKAARKADGLELRNGQLNPALRYPRTRGAKGQTIGKVAAIHGVHRAIGEGYDTKRSTIDQGMKRVLQGIHKGRADGAVLIYKLLGIPIRRAQRAAAARLGINIDGTKGSTGRMRKAIIATVFEGGRVGARGAASSGEVAAGDDPKRPKPNEAV